MMEEIEFLTKEAVDNGGIEVSVFGGAMLLQTDDYARNALSLLTALYQSDRMLNMVHLCVGPYNTEKDKDGKPKSILSGGLPEKLGIVLS